MTSTSSGFIGCCGAETIYIGSLTKENCLEQIPTIRHVLRLHPSKGMFLIILTDLQVDAGISEPIEELGFKKTIRAYNGNSGYWLNLYALTRGANGMVEK